MTRTAAPLAGPRDAAEGSPAPLAGAREVAAEPSVPLAGAREVVAEPSVPLAGAREVVAEPSVPLAGAREVAAGPSAPLAGAREVVAGPSAPLAGPREVAEGSPAPLAGRRALVTGAGRGLGRAVAVALAGAGADVTAVARTATDLATIDGCRALPCDVTDPAALATLPEADILVVSAGTNVPEPFLGVAPATFDRVLDLNLRAAFFTAQAVARGMVARGRGAIVFVSSQMGHVGAPNRSVYCASKHAIEGLTKALAVELAPHGVRVNAVAPTYIRTPMTAPFFADRAFERATEAAIPLGRIGEPADVTGAVLFLCSDAARLITGTSLVVDGGYTAQ